MDKLIKFIKNAERVVLSTHRQCDGDGLGAEIGMFHALRELNKSARIINVDPTPKKYGFLEPDRYIEYFETQELAPVEADLCLIFDTNDERMLGPLFPILSKGSKTLAFVDHHPILKVGPQPTYESYIDCKAASTGEIAYDLIKKSGANMTTDIARGLYTSIAFDTQLFRYIRNSPKSHQIAAELLQYPIKATDIHRSMFGNQTVNKMAFLAKALSQIDYFCEGRFALVRLKDSELLEHHLEPEDSRDVIDMLMNIETLEAAALFREDGNNKFKLSFRSKGLFEVLPVAEIFGGGGHIYAAGAFVDGDYNQLKEQVIKEMTTRLLATDAKKIPS